MRAWISLDGRRHRVRVVLDRSKFTAEVDGEEISGELHRDRGVVVLGGKDVQYKLTAEGIRLGGRSRVVRWEADLGPQAGALAGDAGHSIRPPMPGRVVVVLVKVGDKVTRGQPLLHLEAMKMQNELVAPAAGTITAVHVTAGAVVSATDILVELS